MIKEITCRALQISTMENDQIQRLHDIEKSRGHRLPNWNIQELFHLHSIKEHYGLTEDDLESHAVYQSRIENEINRSGIRNMVDITPNTLDWYHSFDWAIYNNKEKIEWYHSSGKGKGLLQRLANVSSVLLLMALK